MCLDAMAEVNRTIVTSSHSENVESDEGELILELEDRDAFCVEDEHAECGDLRKETEASNAAVHSKSRLHVV